MKENTRKGYYKPAYRLPATNSMGRQGLKPFIFGLLNIAAEAATHKAHLYDRFRLRFAFSISVFF
jgi:hypothetical protein